MVDLFSKYTKTVERTEPIKISGRIVRVQGLLIESDGPQAVVGEICRIHIGQKEVPVLAEVVGLQGRTVQLMPFEEVNGIEIGCKVTATGEFLEIPVSNALLGRVLDGLGRSLDGGPDPGSSIYYPVVNTPPPAMQRRPIDQKISTGVRAIDGLIPLGKGQRLGIFAGSGVGKSTLLGMIARNTNADVNVVALIGERGREVREFIENELGPEGLKRSVIIVSTGDTPPLARLRGAYTATAIAEYFRDQGKDVMLMFDSVTRFANAQREIGLAIGEPPATRGYTPSVFSMLPKLLERCGTSEKGTITGLYTILVDGDDMEEPISDAVRGILDGHMVLSRKLAEQYHYPAIDVLKSVSRLANKIMSPQARDAYSSVRKTLAIYNEAEDLINAGAYSRGANPELDVAIGKMGAIKKFLQQKVEEPSDSMETLTRLMTLAGLAEAPVTTVRKK